MVRGAAERHRVIRHPGDGPAAGDHEDLGDRRRPREMPLAHDVDRLVRKLGEEIGGPIVPEALGHTPVDQLLHHHIGDWLDHVHRRRTEVAERSEPLLRVLERSRPARDHPDHGLPADGLRNDSSGGALISATPAQSSSGAFAMTSRKLRSTSRAIGAGYMSMPASS